jgi:aminoglycoside 2'-N-acetyltransferase I
MAELRTAHTSSLDAGTLRAVRTLLDEAFDGDVDDNDYEHALGGIHAMLWEGRDLIGHGSVVLRRLLHGGRALRTGYVEGVAVRPDLQRQGHGASLMAELENVIRRAYELGALGSSEIAASFYAARGWLKWSGTALAITPGGLKRTPEEEGWIYVYPVDTPLDLDGDLACDWRDGDVW